MLVNKENNFFFKRFFENVFFVLISGIYLYVAYTSFGFDDEFSNIKIIENNDLLNTIKIINSNDVHPPLSYVLNWLLYNSLKNWSYVRSLITVGLLASLLNFYRYLKFEKNNIQPFLVFLLISLDPSILMWGTSIRWYSFYLIVLFWLLIKPKRSTSWFLIKFPLGILILAYLNYITFLIFIPLSIYYFSDSVEIILRKKKTIIGLIFISSIFYLNQLIIFFNVHIENASGQISTLKSNLIGLFVSGLSNQGLFPISVFGLISIFSTLILFGFIFFQIFQEKKGFKYLIIYFIMLGSFFVSGIAGKFRNLTIIEPFKYISLGQIKIKNYITAILFTSLIVSNMVGISNVINHSNTTKNDWNISTSEVLDKTNDIYKTCGKKMQIIHYSNLFEYHLKNNKYDEINLYTRDINNNLISQDSKCVLLIKTFRGSLSKNKYSLILDQFNNPKLKLKEVYKFSKDNYASLKRRLDSDFPDYAAILKLYVHD